MKTLACLLVMLCFAAAPVKRITTEQGDTLAVIVPQDVALAHTPQFISAEIGPNFAKLRDAVKVNIVARDLETAAQARESIRKAFPIGSRPAVSVVIGSVPQGMPAMLDCILATARQQPGSRIYIAGQAEKGAGPTEAAAKTLAGLLETLKFVGCGRDEVVQARCFLTPMSAQEDVIEEFTKVFGERTLSLSFVEWKSDLPIEIELVAFGPSAPSDAPAIEYLTPPGKTASPLFARVVRVNRGDLILIGDIYAKEAGKGEAQVLSIFDQFQAVLKETNSDLRHLVKATYYVSDDDAGKQLNVLRPRFYDPARPPAASKAMVSEVGMLGRSISIDMIAVPSTQPTREPASTRRAESGRK